MLSKLAVLLQILNLVALLALCKGLYVNKGEPYLDFFPSFDKHELHIESYKAGCIMWSMEANKGALVMADWQKCMKMADETYMRDSD